MVIPLVPMVQYTQIDSIGVSGDKKGLVSRGWLIHNEYCVLLYKWTIGIDESYLFVNIGHE